MQLYQAIIESDYYTTYVELFRTPTALQFFDKSVLINNYINIHLPAAMQGGQWGYEPSIPPVTSPDRHEVVFFYKHPEAIFAEKYRLVIQNIELTIKIYP